MRTDNKLTDKHNQIYLCLHTSTLVNFPSYTLLTTYTQQLGASLSHALSAYAAARAESTNYIRAC